MSAEGTPAKSPVTTGRSNVWKEDTDNPTLAKSPAARGAKYSVSREDAGCYERVGFKVPKKIHLAGPCDPEYVVSADFVVS
ncbi:unnamed protein product [Strongylus vulgaris]|uniref:Uncharacterized protein n=1 Tax=Strongylus vulgaris TaxID=40348 RepID=A0A3P7JHI9_STRVU|nr:unnamed protein product [Strongylus vulgaris]